MANQYIPNRFNKMLLQDKTGIKCDLCGEIFKSHFVYYSYDCHKVTVNLDKMETKKEQAIDVEGSTIGYDVCEVCHGEILKRMLENQK